MFETILLVTGAFPLIFLTTALMDRLEKRKPRQLTRSQLGILALKKAQGKIKENRLGAYRDIKPPYSPSGKMASGRYFHGEEKGRAQYSPQDIRVLGVVSHQQAMVEEVWASYRGLFLPFVDTGLAKKRAEQIEGAKRICGPQTVVNNEMLFARQQDALNVMEEAYGLSGYAQHAAPTEEPLQRRRQAAQARSRVHGTGGLRGVSGFYSPGSFGSCWF